MRNWTAANTRSALGAALKRTYAALLWEYEQVGRCFVGGGSRGAAGGVGSRWSAAVGVGAGRGLLWGQTKQLAGACVAAVH